MCKFKSGIILKNKIILAPEGNESHSDLLKSLNIEDTHLNASKTFVRAELIPKDGNKATDVKDWKYIVDQDIVPDWYEEDPKRYEDKFRTEVKYWLKGRFIIMAGQAWTKIKEDEKNTYYLLEGSLENSEFGKTNNYAKSYIREKLNSSDLAKKLKGEFGDKLIPITTDLLSLDGLDDYGTITGDVLAIPTFDLYRECRKNISKLGKWWWLATPDSTPTGCGSGSVRCVGSSGDVDCGWRNGSEAVRPFCIIQS